MYRWERWLFHDRVTLNVSAYPHHWGYHWRDNGGRKPNECWDTTLAIGVWQFNLILWQIGRWSWLLRWLPARRLCVGWTKKG